MHIFFKITYLGTAKAILEKNKGKVISLSNVKITVIKTVCYWTRDRDIDWIEMYHPHIYVQLILTQSKSKWRRDWFFYKWCWSNGKIYTENVKLNYNSHFIKRIISKIDHELKYETENYKNF